MLRSRVPPLRLQAGAARGRCHNGLLVTSDLREMTATRPVTTPNLHCAPPCAKPADHHDTPQPSKTGVFQRRTKKEQRRAPKLHIADKGPIATTRATCDVRAELRLVHWAWRGRDSPAPQGHARRAGVVFFVRRSSARTAPFCVAITTATFHRVAFLSCVLFSRHAVCSCGGRRLALCTWPTGQGGVTPGRGA